MDLWFCGGIQGEGWEGEGVLAILCVLGAALNFSVLGDGKQERSEAWDMEDIV